MIFAGSGGHARELYDVLLPEQQKNLFVFEETETGQLSKWQGLAEKITGITALENLLDSDSSFALAVGKPYLREKFFHLFHGYAAKPVSVIAATAQVSHIQVTLADALNIMHFVFVSNHVTIGTGVLLNTGCRIHHDCEIGDFSEISPNATITGNCRIGKKCSIGASATVLPGITIGDNVVVGAGAVVTKNIESNKIVAGVPSRIIRSL